MVAGGNVTYTCKTCGEKFIGWASAKRIYCSGKCAMPAVISGVKTHGESRSRLYAVWSHMKSRCNREKHAAFAYYGGRGITVCDAWRFSFEAFKAWALANGYEDGLEIDREDVNGNYEPGNCRWATRTEQMRNTRKRCDAQTSKFKGVSRHSKNDSWIAQIGINGRTRYLGSYGTEIEAARRYDQVALELFGQFARLNFPGGKSADAGAAAMHDATAERIGGTC